MRTWTMIAALALLFGCASLALAQGGDPFPPEKPKEGPQEGPEEGPEEGPKEAPKPPPEEKKPLDERKRKFMESFQRRLTEIQKDETSPEREEVARLEDLKRDYKKKLDNSEEELGRAKKVVIESFKKLVDRNKEPEEVETRCEVIWLDYLRKSRDNKAAIYEYNRALKGLGRRINFIRAREVERDFPSLDYQKYYAADNIEIYAEEEGLDFDVFGGKKSHVSYYALLKDFVLEVTGGGRGNDEVIEKMVDEPPLIRLYKRWRARAASRKK
ncbi:MAG: hypothetical protein ACYS47_00290 [Planctomycetota bacterium]